MRPLCRACIVIANGMTGGVAERKVVIDVRGEVLRIGLCLYQDDVDVDGFLATASRL